jgi:hypothetical protein
MSAEKLPGDETGRCNPVNAPKNCSSGLIQVLFFKKL